MTKILIFYGPTSEFEKIVRNDYENSLSLYEMLEKSKGETSSGNGITVELEDFYESIIINSTDFANLSDTGIRILNELLTLFVKHYEIKNIFMQNPTGLIEKNLTRMVDNKTGYELEIIKHKYPIITKKLLLEIYENYSNHIIGQGYVKDEILTSLYTLYKRRNKKEPLVIMFYGPSGVGKTETADYLSKVLTNESPFRTQMSMFQNNKSLDYLFGEEHNSKSFALDLLERESNIILLDEFDKTFATIHSAFYQMFDEGVFKDRNYNVDLEDAIIICTSNYNNEIDIRNSIGAPLYYRFNKLIKFQALDKESTIQIIDKVFEETLNKLDDVEKRIVNESGLIQYIKNEIDSILLYNTSNYRQIKNTIEDLVNFLLVEELVVKGRISLSEFESK